MKESQFKFVVYRKDGKKLIPLCKYTNENETFYIIAQNPDLVIKENGKDVTKSYKKAKNK